MNQRGDVTLTALLFLIALSALVSLSALELHRSFSLLKKRTQLFLCTKETKGEMHEFLRFMGRTNWALQNLEKAKLVMLVIPGLQGGAMKAHKTKKILKRLQNLRLIPYMKKLGQLKSKGCPLDPRLLQTPFHLSATGFQRGKYGEARLRSQKWRYQFVSLPYILELSINASGMISLNPRMEYSSQERGGRLFSHLSSL